MSQAFRGSSSTAAETACPAGSEAITAAPLTQRARLAAQLIRTSLARLELLDLTGTLHRVSMDIRSELCFSLELLDGTERSQADGFRRDYAEMLETNRELAGAQLAWGDSGLEHRPAETLDADRSEVHHG